MNLKPLYNNKRKTVYLVNVYLTLKLLLDNLDLDLRTGLCDMLIRYHNHNKITDEAYLDTAHFLNVNEPNFIENLFIGNTKYNFQNSLGYYYKSGLVLPRKRLLKYYISSIEIEAIKSKYIIFARDMNLYKKKGVYVDSLFEAHKYNFGEVLAYKHEYPDLEIQLA